jgi:hypothetical protein
MGMAKCPYCKKNFERDVDIRIVYPDNADAPGMRCAIFMCPNKGCEMFLGATSIGYGPVQGADEL